MVAGLLCVLFCSTVAVAATEALELTLRAPTECGSADRIEGAVAGLVRTSPKGALRATLNVWRLPDGYTAEIRTDPAQRRVVRAASCQAVVEAAVVILALAIDSTAERQTPNRSLESSRRDAAEKTREKTAVALLIGADSAIDTSTLPHVAAGVTLRAGLTGATWLGLAELTYWLPASASLENNPSFGGRFSWWTVGLSGCFAPFARGMLHEGSADSRKPRLSLCVSPELGRLQGRGTGANTDNRTARATWLAAAAGPSLALPFAPRLALRVYAELAVTILGSHPFILEGSTGQREVHRPSRLSGRGGLGLDVVF